MTSNDNDENDDSNVKCACTQSISKQDWQDHQIICPKRRFTCPAYVAYINCDKDNEYSLSLVDSNCPPSLKEIAKLQVLQNEKENRSKWLESNKIPFMIIHTLRKECPTFGRRQELMKHIENSCPYWKVKCLHMDYNLPTMITINNSHQKDKCSVEGLSRQDFISHSKETSLDPISQRIRANPKIFPYYCKECDHHFPSSGCIHICIKDINTRCDDSEILCPGCKSIIRANSNKNSQVIENTCVNCHNNKVPVMPGAVLTEEIFKWRNGMEKRMGRVITN